MCGTELICAVYTHKYSHVENTEMFASALNLHSNAYLEKELEGKLFEYQVRDDIHIFIEYKLCYYRHLLKSILEM